MSFLAPGMLWGLAAVSLPVILHLLYRSRYRTVPWAAMKFLLRSIQETRRRIRFQELLLLLVRSAILLFLALALARPTTAAGAGGGDAVDAVLLLDTSYSMGAREGADTRFERARRAALAVLDHLPAGSTAQLIACSARAVPLGPPAASNLELARERLRALELSHEASDLYPGVVLAAETLARGSSPNKELWIFSDFQKSAWEAQGPALAARLRELAARASVTLVRCGTRPPRNVTLAGVSLQSGIPHTGDRLAFAVLVRNTGREPLRDLTVRLEVDGKPGERETQAISELGPGETRAVTLTGRFEKAGLRTVWASVGPDELEEDNHFFQVIPVREQARVLVVDGAPGDLRPEAASAFYLLHSLHPVPESAWAAYPVQPRAVGPLEASPGLLAEADLCVFVNAPVAAPGERDPGALSEEFLDRLGDFVREGRGVLIFAGPRVSPDAYARALFDARGLLPYRPTARRDAPAEEPFRFDPRSADPVSFLAPFREEPLSRLDQTVVLHALGLEERPSDDARVLLRFADGAPAAAARRAGSGEVVFVATSADLRWSDWPLRPTFLPFVHAVLGRLLGARGEAHNLAAGRSLQWTAPGSEASRIFVLEDPAGRRTRLGAPVLVDGRPVVRSPILARAGFYRIAPARPADAAPEKEGVPVFAAAPDLRESEDLESLSAAQIDERLGARVAHRVAGEDLSAFAGTERLRREWTLWLLSAVVALVGVETVLAWLASRGR